MPCPEDVVDADDVLMVETQQDLDLPQCALAVRLVLKGADLLDCHTLAGHVVHGRAEQGRKHKRGVMLHSALFRWYQNQRVVERRTEAAPMDMTHSFQRRCEVL